MIRIQWGFQIRGGNCLLMKYKIVIVDDDVYRAQQYVDQLNIHGFDAIAIDSIPEVLEIASYEEYQGFVLDIQMNDTSNIFSLTETHGGWATGLALFHKLRDIRPDVKIVALTYSTLPEAVEWFTYDESVDYFNKEEYNPKMFPTALYHSLNDYYGIDYIEQYDNEILSESSNTNTKFFNKWCISERIEVKMEKKLQIFVSSTYTDLIEERQAAVEAILQSGNIPAGMELFKSSSESQLETIKRWIDESDIYLLILGGRYGSLEPKSQLSYTHLEYNYALKKNIPLFSIVISDNTLKEKVKSFGTEIIELQNIDKYNDLKKQVLGHTSQFYNDTKDIKIHILNSIHDFEKRYKFTGWVSGKYLLDYNRIKDENDKLISILNNKQSNCIPIIRDGLVKEIEDNLNFIDMGVESVNYFIKKITSNKNAVNFVNWFMKNIYDPTKHEFSKRQGDNSNLHLYATGNNTNIPIIEKFLLRMEYKEKQNHINIIFEHNRGKYTYISRLKDYKTILMNNGYNNGIIIINNNISEENLFNIEDTIKKLFE